MDLRRNLTAWVMNVESLSRGDELGDPCLTPDDCRSRLNTMYGGNKFVHELMLYHDVEVDGEEEVVTGLNAAIEVRTFRSGSKVTENGFVDPSLLATCERWVCPWYHWDLEPIKFHEVVDVWEHLNVMVGNLWSRQFIM